MSDAQHFGIRQIGYGDNPENDPPEPSFESPALNLEGMAIAVSQTPEARALERRLTSIAGMMLARLIRCVNAECMKGRPDLKDVADGIERHAASSTSAEMDRITLLGEYAFKNTGHVLAFKDAVRETRDPGKPSDKLNDVLEKLSSLRSYAA